MNIFHTAKAFNLAPIIGSSFFSIWLFCGTLILGRGADAIPDSGLLNGGLNASEADARAIWQPMTGTAPVSISTQDGHKAWRFPCNLAGTKIERASWDRSVKLDLATGRGIEFQLLCRDASSVSYFSLYLQSGEGWYHATFFPESTNDWNLVTLDKAVFGTEGKPAGWGQIRTIRISAWRGQDRNTEFFLRNLRLTGQLGSDAFVAIVRGDSVAQSQAGETRSVTQFTETTAQMLASVGLGCAVISDLDLTLERLKAAQVVILPYNPSLPERAAEILNQFAQHGGKMLAFYSVPALLNGVLGVQAGQHIRESRPGYFASIRARDNSLPGAPPLVGQRSWNINAVQPVSAKSQVLAEWLDDQGQPTGQPAIVGSTNALVMTHVLLPDDRQKKGRLLLAMVGFLAPDLWQQAAQAGLNRAGAIGPAKDFDQAAAMLASLVGQKPRARQALDEARALRNTARELIASQQFPAALDATDKVRGRLTEAWCLAQPALPGEFRAFWCHSAYGVDGLSWDEALQRLAQNGFTAILPNMLWGGAAFYESKVLPVAPTVAQRGDQIAQCLAAAHKYGLQVHVWKVNWNLGGAVPPAFVDQMRRAGRLQADAQGKEERWLCPSHPDNQRLEIASMLEVVRKYDIDGLHFDYIRYPDHDHCFCAGCQERFQRAANTKITHWPRDVQVEGPLRQQWLEWRRGNITTVVQAVSEQAHALKPNLKISAAVFSNWASDRDGVGQDWKLWCERGWLDFVCPMDYTASQRQFENMVIRQVDWAGRTPCYPGIGASASSPRLGVDGVIEQIKATRRHNTRGFVIFNYGVSEAKELLPLLGLGITAR